jgi:hypothetical protein
LQHSTYICPKLAALPVHHSYYKRPAITMIFSLLVVLFISRIQSQSAPSTTALLTLSDDGTVMVISELAFHPPPRHMA